MPEELWWGSWILAGLAVLVAGVGVGSRHAAWTQPYVLGAAAAWLPALALGLLRARGRVIFEYGVRPPRTHGLVLPTQAPGGPLRRHVEEYPAPKPGELRDYHVFAAVAVFLFCLFPVMPFIFGDSAGFQSLTCLFAGSLFGAGALGLFLRRLNADR